MDVVEKPEATAVTIDPNFSSYLFKDFLHGEFNRKGIDTVYLSRYCCGCFSFLFLFCVNNPLSNCSFVFEDYTCWTKMLLLTGIKGNRGIKMKFRLQIRLSRSPMGWSIS